MIGTRSIPGFGTPYLGGEIHEGDCLEVMKWIPDRSVDMVLCDLPYGVTDNPWDTVIPFDLLWEAYHRIVKKNGAIVLTCQGIFGAKLMLSNEKNFRYKIIWVKSIMTGFLNAAKRPLRKYEDICVFYREHPVYHPQMSEGIPYTNERSARATGSYRKMPASVTENNGQRYPTDIIRFQVATHEGDTYHPTQKPVELGRYLIRTYTDPGDTVLDNAFGSGSFLVAAALEGRRFIGIEKNEKACRFKDEPTDFVQVAKKRLMEVEVNA